MHLLLKLRDAGKPLPACAVLISPALAPILSTDSSKENARKDAMLSRSAVQTFHAAYEPEENMITLTDTFIDSDLYGLPPLLFQASRAETLRDDAILGSKSQTGRSRNGTTTMGRTAACLPVILLGSGSTRGRQEDWGICKTPLITYPYKFGK